MTAPKMLSLALWFALFFLGIALCESNFESRCLSFQPQRLYPNSTLTRLEYVRANTTLLFADNVASCNRRSQLVVEDICRVAMSLPTSRRSSVTFEAWLPMDWKNRFLATGNGGIDGCIKYEDLSYGSQNGFATVGSNNGHNGTTGVTFLNNGEVVTDYAFRSLHTITDFGKKITSAFYNQTPRKSYYLGCSLGGRMGIKAAEQFPFDYDGIVAGAPAVDFNHLQAWRGRFFPITGGQNDSNFITAATWKGLIHDEVLRQCDGIDGAADGIIEDPTLCSFNPSKMLCGKQGPSSSSTSSSCLNQAQIDIVRRVFSPLLGTNDEILYPGMQPGSEDVASTGLYAGTPWPPSLDWFKYVIYDPSWNGSRMSPEDIKAAEDRNPSNVRTFPSELNQFKARGGKILTYHGQQDNQITSFNSIRLFDRLNKGMNGDLDPFYRFFRISGMNHCSTGPGAWVFGQGGNGPAQGIPFESERNVLASIVHWVENGVAPEHLVGTKFVNDSVSEGEAFQRKHCRYPFRNTFIGADPHDVDDWECR